MMIKTENILYSEDGTLLEGYMAYSPGMTQPLVILCHPWNGRDDFICQIAQLIASWGYAGFALDLYGKGVLGKSKEENMALKAPFLKDRGLLKKRLLKAFDVASALPFIDPNKIASFGVGFGGMASLDLARSGMPIKGAASAFGFLDAPKQLKASKIQAKILIFHGYKDPLISLNDLSAFEKEMDEAKADWQLHLYGNTYHGFLYPQANDLDSGLVYQETAAKRTWNSLHHFLEEIFA